jgi:hypothetical protein
MDVSTAAARATALDVLPNGASCNPCRLGIALLLA